MTKFPDDGKLLVYNQTWYIMHDINTFYISGSYNTHTNIQASFGIYYEPWL